MEEDPLVPESGSSGNESGPPNLRSGGEDWSTPPTPPPAPPSTPPMPSWEPPAKKPWATLLLSGMFLVTLVGAAGILYVLSQQSEEVVEENVREDVARAEEKQALTRQIAKLQGEIDQMRTSREQDTGSKAALEEQVEVLKNQCAELIEEKEQLAEENKTYVEDNKNLLAQFKVGVQVREEVQKDRDLLAEALARMEQEKVEMLTKHAPLKNEAMQLKSKLMELEQINLLLEEDRDELEKSVAELEAKPTERELRHELKRVKKEQEALRRRLRESEKKFATLEQVKIKKDQDYIALESEFAQLRQGYTEAVADNAELEHRIQDLPEDVKEVARVQEKLLKDTADAHYNLGVMFTEKKDFNRALTEFHKVIELRPDDLDAMYNLGVIYAEHVPNRERAMQYFRRYLEERPAGPDSDWARKYIASWQVWGAKGSWD